MNKRWRGIRWTNKEKKLKGGAEKSLEADAAQCFKKKKIFTYSIYLYMKGLLGL